MKPQDFRTLYLALGLVMVLVKENGLRRDGDKTALRLAKLIEEFCGAHKTDYIIPHADQFEMPQKIADAMIAATEARGACDDGDLEQAGFAPEDLSRFWSAADTLARIHHRWAER